MLTGRSYFIVTPASFYLDETIIVSYLLIYLPGGNSGSITVPFLIIQKAADLIQPGGSYTGNSNWNKSADSADVTSFIKN